MAALVVKTFAARNDGKVDTICTTQEYAPGTLPSMSLKALLGAEFGRYAHLQKAGRKSFSNGKLPVKPRPFPALPAASRKIPNASCTNFGHPLVDALHSIENTHLANAVF